MEVDLRSRERRERNAHLFVDKKQSPLFFYGIPEKVKIGILFTRQSWIDFESLEELSESGAVKGVEGEYGYFFEGEEVVSGDVDRLVIKR